MDIEKLIRRLRNDADAYRNGETLGRAFADQEDVLDNAATALSTLQAENEKLREKIEDARLEGYTKGLGEMSEENERLWAELEHVKSERAVALEHLHGICSACKNYSPYHNRGKCRFCVYEPVRNNDAEANDNWEWSGPEKED